MGKLELLLTLLLFKQMCGTVCLEPTGQFYNIPWSMMIFQAECCCRWTLLGDWLHWPFSLTVWIGSLADFLFQWEIWITRWTCCKLLGLLSFPLPFNTYRLIFTVFHLTKCYIAHASLQRGYTSLMLRRKSLLSYDLV